MYVHFLVADDSPIICDHLYPVLLTKKQVSDISSGSKANSYSVGFLNMVLNRLYEHNWLCMLRSLQIRDIPLSYTARFSLAIFKRNFSVLNIAVSAYQNNDYISMGVALRMQIDSLVRVSIPLWTQGDDAEHMYKHHITTGKEFCFPLSEKKIPDSVLLKEMVSADPNFDMTVAYKSMCSAIHATADGPSAADMHFSYRFTDDDGNMILDHSDPVIQIDNDLMPYAEQQKLMYILIMTLVKTMVSCSFYVSSKYDTLYGDHIYSKKQNIVVKANKSLIDHFAELGIIEGDQNWDRYTGIPEQARDPLWYFDIPEHQVP